MQKICSEEFFEHFESPQGEISRVHPNLLDVKYMSSSSRQLTSIDTCEPCQAICSVSLFLLKKFTV
jgi:hypothetical protein